MKILIPAMVIALALSACGGGAEPDAAADAEETESVFDPMTDQIEKAKEVEDAALQHKEDIDKALDDVER
jgi:ABC-type glycerol-3-phosphate transport system substrate-binding protein